MTSLPSKQLLLSLVPGFIFGFALQHGRVHENSIVIGQMSFSHFVMLKMFLSALGASLLVGSAFLSKVATSPEQREALYQRSTRGVRAVVVGGAILGIGMALSGSCPGTVYAQLGSLSVLAIIIFFGGIIGAGAFAYLFESPKYGLEFQRFLRQDMLPIEYNALYKIVNAKFQLQLTSEDFCRYLGAGLIILASILDTVINWRTDLSMLYPHTYEEIGMLQAWSPIFSGLLIGGVAQALSLSLRNTLLGCSGTFTEFGQLITRFAKKYQHFAPVAQLISVLPNEFTTEQARPQPITAVSMVLGAFFGSIILNRELFIGTNALDFPMSNFGFFVPIIFFLRYFIGGVCIVLGARIAGGCTSGVGLSYASSGSTTAFLGIVAMFGSAIITGFALHIL